MIFVDRIMLFFKGVILRDKLSNEDGYVSNLTRTELVGKEGITLTALNPVGYVEFDNDRIEVISEGFYVEKNKKVTVVKVEGFRVLVRVLE